MNDEIRLYLDRDFISVAELEQGEKGSPYSAAVFIRQCSVIFPHTFIVMEHDSGIIGYAISAFVQGSLTDIWILRMKIAIPFRNKGYGNLLLSALIALIEEKGAKKIWLSVSPENHAALALYRKKGFLTVSQKTAYFGENEDRLILLKTLVSDGDHNGDHSLLKDGDQAFTMINPPV